MTIEWNVSAKPFSLFGQLNIGVDSTKAKFTLTGKGSSTADLHLREVE